MQSPSVRGSESRSLRYCMHRGTSGFSLAELMLAITVWASAFLTICALYSTCRGAVMRSANIIVATNIAQSQIETLKFAAFANVQSQPETLRNGDCFFNGTKVSTAFYYTVTVTPGASANLKDVVVEVNWQEAGVSGTARSTWEAVKMETVISQ